MKLDALDEFSQKLLHVEAMRREVQIMQSFVGMLKTDVKALVARDKWQEIWCSRHTLGMLYDIYLV